MKINGTTPRRVTETITIKKESGNISFTLQALPLGFEDKVYDWLPAPKPPKKVTTKAGRDGGTKTEVEERDDPSFLSEFREIRLLQGMAWLYESLKADPSVTWETQEGKKTKKEFYSAILEELREANITSGDMALLLDKVMSMSNGRFQVFQEIREGFSSEASS